MQNSKKNLILGVVAAVLLVCALLAIFQDSIFGGRAEPAPADTAAAAAVNAASGAGADTAPPEVPAVPRNSGKFPAAPRK